jgi:hypothetical protein
LCSIAEPGTPHWRRPFARLLSQLQELFVGQAAQQRIRENFLAPSGVALHEIVDQLADVTSPVQRGDGKARLRARPHAHRPPMPNGMSGSDNSIAGGLHPPPNLGRGRSITPFRIEANERDQNSAGKYPLISRPTQISKRVGVVQAIGHLPSSFQTSNKLGRRGAARKARNHCEGAQTPLSQKGNYPGTSVCAPRQEAQREVWCSASFEG